MPSAPTQTRYAKCAVSLTRRRRSRADVRVSRSRRPSLVVAALLSPPFVAAVRATSPRRRTSPRLCRSASRRRQLLASTLLLPPLVDAAPHRVAPLVASTPLLPPLLSRRTPLPYTASPRCHTSSTSFLSSPLHLSSPLDATPPRRRYLFLSARVSARATRTAAYVHVLFVGLPRYCVCVRRTMRKRFAVRVS